MTRLLPALLLCLCLCPARVAAQTGGPYSLLWHTLDGGGATFATGGVYRLGSTTGQPDAGVLSGGPYALHGGFWAAGGAAVVAAPAVRPVPDSFVAHLPAPNPFRDTTTLAFDLPSPAHVRLDIHGVDGRLVRRLVDGDGEAGYHRAHWDGRDDGGRPVASGIYFVRLSAGVSSSTQRIVRLK